MKLGAREGDFVKKGQIMAQLDDSQVSARVTQAKASVEVSKARFSAAQTKLEVLKKDVPLKVDTAKADVSHARAQLVAAKAGARQAGRDAGRMKTLLKEGAVEKHRNEQADLTWTAKRSELVTAQEVLKQAQKSAEQDARNVIGVWRVKNHLKVRPVNIPSDDELEKQVANALLGNLWVNRFEIDIDAVAGCVYLSGNVTTFFEKKEAERVAEGVKGVTNVINNITYPDSWTWKPDQDIRENVKHKLFWSPYVDEDEVSVTVSNSVVTLSGNVDTWSERQAAEDNAYEGGAKKVINNLTVTYRYYGPYYLHYPYWPYY